MYKVGDTKMKINIETIRLIMMIVITFCVISLSAMIILNSGLGFEHNKIKITEEEYLTIQEELPKNIVRICNLENKNCIVIVPIN